MALWTGQRQERAVCWPERQFTGGSHLVWFFVMCRNTHFAASVSSVRNLDKARLGEAQAQAGSSTFTWLFIQLEICPFRHPSRLSSQSKPGKQKCCLQMQWGDGLWPQFDRESGVCIEASTVCTSLSWRMFLLSSSPRPPPMAVRSEWPCSLRIRAEGGNHRSNEISRDRRQGKARQGKLHDCSREAGH